MNPVFCSLPDSGDFRLAQIKHSIRHMPYRRSKLTFWTSNLSKILAACALFVSPAYAEESSPLLPILEGSGVLCFGEIHYIADNLKYVIDQLPQLANSFDLAFVTESIPAVLNPILKEYLDNPRAISNGIEAEYLYKLQLAVSDLSQIENSRSLHGWASHPYFIPMLKTLWNLRQKFGAKFTACGIDVSPSDPNDYNERLKRLQSLPRPLKKAISATESLEELARGGAWIDRETLMAVQSSRCGTPRTKILVHAGAGHCVSLKSPSGQKLFTGYLSVLNPEKKIKVVRSALVQNEKFAKENPVSHNHNLYFDLTTALQLSSPQARSSTNIGVNLSKTANMTATRREILGKTDYILLGPFVDRPNGSFEIEFEEFKKISDSLPDQE